MATEKQSELNKSGTPIHFNNPTGPLKKLSIFFGIMGAIFLLLYIDNYIGHNAHNTLPVPGETVSYGLLLIAGLLTGFHCVGMCGAMVVSYTANSAKSGESNYGSHLLYGAGKTLSYTLIGALFGVIGAIITFTPYMRGVAGLIAGVFLLLFGLSMLNVFSRLNRFQIKTPKFIIKFVGQSARKHSHPFIIGMLNGLMIICGPLQAMYILAAGTGDPIEGAKMLFVFGIGTLPVMLGFGMMASTLSRQMAPKLLKASGIIVIALGIIMLNRGLMMTGTGYDLNSLMVRMNITPVEANISEPEVATSNQHEHQHTAATTQTEPEEEVQVIHMNVGETFAPNQFRLKKGVPVKWVINGVQIHPCNNRIVIPSLGLEFDVKEGENIVEFTPVETGVVAWSCWMGMMPGAFVVYDEETTEAEIEAAQHSIAEQATHTHTQEKHQ